MTSSQHQDLPITTDVISNELFPKLDARTMLACVLSNKRWCDFFNTSDFWNKQIKKIVSLSNSALISVNGYVAYSVILQRLERLEQSFALPKTIKSFIHHPDNHAKLLMCLSNHATLIAQLPASEDAIWLHVALVAECPVVYQTILKRNPLHTTGLQLAFLMGNFAAVQWIRANMSHLKSSYWPLEDKELELSARSGNLKLLQTIIKEKTGSLSYGVLFESMRSGNIECVEWLYATYGFKGDDKFPLWIPNIALECDRKVFELVVKRAGISLQQTPVDSRLVELAMSNKIKTVKTGFCDLITLLLDKHESTSESITPNLLSDAIDSGSFDAVHLVMQRTQCIPQHSHIENSIYHGHLTLAQYLVTKWLPDFFVNLTNRLHVASLLNNAMGSKCIATIEYVINQISIHTPDGIRLIYEFLYLKFAHNPFDLMCHSIPGENKSDFSYEKELTNSILNYFRVQFPVELHPDARRPKVTMS